MKVWEGNKERNLRELFNIEGEAEDILEGLTIRVLGDLARVRMVGAKMSGGRILVEGDIGIRLGEAMKGGEIIVAGNAGSWVGSMIKSGRIEVKGSAGNYVGAPYRGSMKGMGGGMIIIGRDAGSEVGCFMKGGTIKVYGNIGQFAGIHMREGTILIQGDSEGRSGAEMLNGKIIICGYVPTILPTFTIEGISSSAKVDGEKIEGPFYRFEGDIANGGEGKIYVSKARNPHLNLYEKYL